MKLINNFIYILNTEFKNKTYIIIGAILFTTLLEILGISLIIPIFALIFDSSNLNDYFYVKKIFLNFDENQIIFLTVSSVLIIYFIKNFLLSFFSIYQSKFIWNLKKYLAERILKQHLSNEKNFFVKRNSSVLLNILTKEISYFVHLLFNSLIFITELLILISIITIMLFFETKVFFSLIILICIYFFSLVLLTKKKVTNLSKSRITFDTDYLRDSSQIIEGYREIKIYNQTNYFLKKFQQINDNIYKINWRLEMFQQLPKYWLEYLILSFVLILVLFLHNNNLGTENIMIVLGLLAIAGARLMPSINRLYQSFQHIKIYLPSLEAVLKEIKNEKNVIINEKKDKLSFNAKLEIKNLYFNYENQKIFENLELSLNKNSMIGIYGPNGSGKSTLLDLLFGFLKPDKGQILVDGLSINRNLNNWQKKISYVPQTIYLSDTNILENITFKEILSEEEKNLLNEILIKSKLSITLDNFKDGIYTNVGERGSKISGGQKQRIGLARALFNKPEILVMDESTNSLDFKTADTIMKTIKDMKDITRIVVSHNLEDLEKCEKIFRLTGHKIKEMKI